MELKAKMSNWIHQDWWFYRYSEDPSAEVTEISDYITLDGASDDDLYYI